MHSSPVNHFLFLPDKSPDLTASMEHCVLLPLLDEQYITSAKVQDSI